MNFFFKSLIQFLIIVFITFLYILAFEIILRASFFLITKNKAFFWYGFDKNISIEIVDLDKFKFNYENLNNVNDLSLKENKIDKKNSKKIVWTFGASFTHGYACGDNSSSWPDELEKINSNLKVINFAFPSIYSNDSLKLLKHNLNNKELRVPDYVIWAHRDEEKLAITRGLGKFEDKIEGNFSFNIDKNLFYLMRLEKTFEQNSVSYLVSKHILKKLKKRFNVNNERINNETLNQEDFRITIDNFKFNTKDAIDSSFNKGVSNFIILSLFSDDQFTRQNNSFFLKYFNETSQSLAMQKNVEFMNLIEMIDPLETDFQNFYCKNKHFTLIGNEVIAKIINSKTF